MVIWERNLSRNGTLAKRLERTISDFIPQFNLLLSVNDNLFHAIDGDDLSRAVRVTGMINKSPDERFDSIK